jgi:transcriptional regulator with XRE-family HTH domain
MAIKLPPTPIEFRMSTPDTATMSLAKSIRVLRTRQKVTVRQLAVRIDRSIGFISQIERGLSQPTVEDLHCISQALGVTYSYFISPEQLPQKQWVTRPEERRTLSFARGVSDRVVSPTISSQLIMLETLLEPGADFGERQIIESTEQGGYVLEGELTLWIADEEIVVRAGDGFQIPSGIPCRCANRSHGFTRVLWVYS